MNKNKIIKIVIFIIVVVLGIFFKDKVGDISFAYVDEEVEVLNNTNLEIYFFDVGQADSIFIKNNTETLLIDGGNNQDGNKLVDYIKNTLNINDIDVVVGTHPHEDHIGGLDSIIDEFDIGKIYLPDVTTNTKSFNDLLESIENKNYSVNVPILDEVFELGNLKFKVMNVDTDENDLNNSSIVLKMNFGNTSYLFMGDATKSVEKKIIDKDIDVDVLKVGHHGSNYSSSEKFIKKVSPKYAMIEVGENNKYDHPNKQVIDLLNKYNSKVYRTDIDGTIKLISDGNKFTLNKLETNLDG